MNREYHRWYSRSLDRDMELLVFGHTGARVLVFPTSMGRFFQWEDSGMDREWGAQDALAFVRRTDFPPSTVSPFG